MDPAVLGALIGGVLATIGGVLGGIVTGWYTLMANKQSLAHEARREERERGLAFRREQLSQFYGPVLACMEELEESWQLLFDADKHVETFLAAHRGKHPSGEFLLDKQNAVVEYKQYLYAREVAVFNKIKEIFISHFGLAEPSTKENYRAVVRFIENRNIINVTERKLDITFTGEDASGVRNRIAYLFQNLIEINTQIRNQLESGEPKPIIQVASELPSNSLPAKEVLTPATQPSFVVAGERQTATKQPAPANQVNKTPTRQNWPGRYTLLSNKASVESAMAAAQAAEIAKKTKPPETDKLAAPPPPQTHPTSR
ncbi:MAG: hypothetical protein C5B53_10040 [Candidatus Melainabacteria bacterium]|nr:MAG: hypothetical protein C5B53_10040 [Candidatus Melainabacteria bacterium]